jgi:hypothetical protein
MTRHSPGAVGRSVMNAATSESSHMILAAARPATMSQKTHSANSAPPASWPVQRMAAQRRRYEPAVCGRCRRASAGAAGWPRGPAKPRLRWVSTEAWYCLQSAELAVEEGSHRSSRYMRWTHCRVDGCLIVIWVLSQGPPRRANGQRLTCGGRLTSGSTHCGRRQVEPRVGPGAGEKCGPAGCGEFRWTPRNACRAPIRGRRSAEPGCV